MSYTYAQCKRPQGTRKHRSEPAVPGPGMDALMTGAARPTAAQKGRPIDLDAAMRVKMEHAFGDLSAVKLYESRAVGEAGAEAIAQGNEIAFAPGMANFSTRSGQERLGHELSHVMSQRSGAVRGVGFLANSALEARADREGAMAAAGEKVYSGPVTHTLSGAAPAPAVAGPMQAKREWGWGKKKSHDEADEMKRYREKTWRTMKKRVSNVEFYDEIDKQMGNGTDSDEIPLFAKQWYWKHQKLGSRMSGKGKWAVPQAYLDRLKRKKALYKVIHEPDEDD